MTIILLQPDGVPITAQQERQGSAALYGGGANRPLGGRSGFRVDTPSDVLTVTTTAWTLKPCSAMIDPGASTHQGMYGWATDANITGTPTAPDATYPRKDIYFIRVNDSSAGDGSGLKSAPVEYLAGTPNASPVAPALPARSFLIATVTVPQVGAGSPVVVVNPARFAAAGAPLPVYSQTERDALVKYNGLTVQRRDLTGRPFETYDGTDWWRTGGPHASAAGGGLIGIVNGGALFGPSWQAFPAGRFTVAPVVTVTTDQSRIISVPGGITKDGFNLYLQNVTGSASNNGTFSWTATQQTPTSATG